MGFRERCGDVRVVRNVESIVVKYKKIEKKKNRDTRSLREEEEKKR